MTTSETILKELLKMHLERLAVLQKYERYIKDPHVKAELGVVIEETQDAIARSASRLRQLGLTSSQQIAEDVSDKLVRQSRKRRTLNDKIVFIWHGLRFQASWYDKHIKNLAHDPASQEVLVVLSAQARITLQRWQTLGLEMKVPATEFV